MASATAYYGLQMTKDLTSEGVSGGAAIGPAQTAVNLTNSEDGVTFTAVLDGGGSSIALPLDTLIPAITSDEVEQMVWEEIVAAGGVTTNGNLAVTLTGANFPNSPVTVQVPVTTALTTATAIATAIAANAGVIAAAASGGYTLSTDGGYALQLTDDTARRNDATLRIQAATGLGVSSILGGQLTGSGPSLCYRLAGTTYTGDNFEGGAVPTADVFHGINIVMVEGGMGVACGNLADVLSPGEAFGKAAINGLPYSFSAVDTLTLTAAGGYGKARVTLMFNHA